MALTLDSAISKDPRPEPDNEEKALVGDFKKRIEAVEKIHADRFKQYEVNRQYVLGNVHEDGAPGLVRTNLIFSTIATLLPQVYAKDPEISCSPSEAVDPEQYKLYKQFGKTLEAVLTRKFVKEPKLKRKAKASVRSAMTCELGWVKLTYQKDIQKDPAIVNRIEDLQENLKRVTALSYKLGSEDTSGKDEDLVRANIEAELNALQDKVEVVLEKGMVVDKLLSESVLVLDASIRDFDEYTRAGAIAQVLWYDEDQYATTFGYKPGQKATIFRAAVAGQSPTQGSASSSSSLSSDTSTAFYCVYEIWDKRTNTVYTWCKGEDGWCRPAFRPSRMGRRWYPFFALAFNPVDGQFYPISDVQLLIELQDEYNTTRTNFADHRKKHIPVRVVRRGGQLTPDDVQKIVEAKTNEIVVVNGAAGGKLQDDMAVLEHPPIDPQVYDTTPIRADIELVSGAQDATRGNVLKAKTATEAEIMQQGLMSRTSERQDAIEDWIQEMAEYTAQILLQELPVNEVLEVAGAKAVWPTLSKEQVFDLINLEIKAGSTGKPNKQREREQWTELVPVIENTIGKVNELRQMGQTDMAEALTELTRETLRRFDERIDVDQFLPPSEEGSQGAMQMAAQVPQLQQELAMTQQALAECQQQLQAAEAQCADKSAEREAKVGMHDKEMALKRDQAAADIIARAHQHKAEMGLKQQTVAARPPGNGAGPVAAPTRSGPPAPQPARATAQSAPQPAPQPAAAPVDIDRVIEAAVAAAIGRTQQTQPREAQSDPAMMQVMMALTRAVQELTNTKAQPIVVDPKPGGGFVVGRSQGMTVQ